MTRTVFFFGALLLTLGLAIAISQNGWAKGGFVVVTPAALGCANSSSDIYVDCGNGTVTDNRTDLIWLKDASCLPGDEATDWADAMLSAAAVHSGSCGLTDNSQPGDWRLAT